MSLDDALARFRAAAKEELSAAWQIHVARVEEQLRAGWREQIDAVVDQRMAEAAALVERETHRASRNLTERINQTARRLRQAAGAAEWTAIVEEAARGFCERAAVHDCAQPGVTQSPAVATLLETKDTVVTLQSRSELPAAVADRIGERTEDRCYLFPILDGARVAAVLFAHAGQAGLDRNGLELIAALAGATIPKPPAQLLMPTPAQPAPGSAASVQLDWSSLNSDEQETHLRAQRFARVRVAEMRLYDAEAVKKGRLERNLYAGLKDKIESARTEFRREFVEKCPSMTDYLHRELVRTLANDDQTALGSTYPGPLVR